MTGPDDELTVGELASRAGVTVSSLHFYERNGLITAHRTAGNQRRFRRSTLRRVAFIRTSVRLGVSLAAIKASLDSLPAGRTPTRRDWARLSRRWRADLDARIEALVALRNGLDECIGCGCLSLQKCRLANPDDALGAEGPGARLLPE